MKHKHIFLRFTSLLLTAVCLGGAFPSRAADSSDNTPFEVDALSAVLMDAATGEILYAKNADEALPPASVTKVMTMLLVMEAIDSGRMSLTDTVTVSEYAASMGGSQVYLEPGEQMSVEDMIKSVVISSANDAATAIAIAVAESEDDFVDMMNETARKIGLRNTHFDNPHGLDSEEHYTTARELALITAEALKNGVFREIVSTYKKLLPLNGVPDRRLVVNHNRLLRTYDGCIGVKTGFTKKDGRCLVSAAERDGITLVAVTLNAPNDWSDHKKMLDHGFASVKRVKISSDGIEGYLPVVGGKESMIKYGAIGDTSAVLPNDTGEFRVVIELPRFVFAPVKKGDIIGRAVFMNGNDEVASLPIEALTDAPKRKVKKTFWQWLLGLFR